MSTVARIRSGAVASGANFATSIAIGVIQVPLILSIWRADQYAVWQLVMALAAIITSLDVGHQTYVGNAMLAANSEEERLRLMASALRIATLLGITQIGIASALIFGPFRTSLLGANREAWTINGGDGALIAYMVHWAVFGSVGGIVNRLYTINGDFARGYWWGIILRTSGFAALAGAVYLGWGVMGAMAAHIAAGVGFNLAVLRDVSNRYGLRSYSWGNGRWSTGLRNVGQSAILSLCGVAEQLAGNGNLIITGKILGPEILVAYVTMRGLANVAFQALAVITQPLAPELVRFHVLGRTEAISATITALWCTGTTIMCGGIIILWPYASDIFVLWTRGEVQFVSPLLASLVTAVLLRQWASPLLIYIAGLNDLKTVASASLIKAVVGTGLTLLIAPAYGIVGVGIGVIAAEVAAALVMVRAVQGRLRLGGRGLSTQTIALSIAQLVSAITAGLQEQVFIRVLAVTVVGLCGYAQWRGLGQNMQNRIMESIGTKPI